MTALRDDGVMCSAEFSWHEADRYSLTRTWGDGDLVAFIGLNPSTANEIEDDPTIRRCMNYARAWGYESMVMLNLFAFRATNPKVMKDQADPVGILNNARLLEWVAGADRVVACWGTHGAHLGRGAQVRAMLEPTPLYTFGLTKNGHPKHPLYLPKSQRLEVWS